jgi:hypothetical protein
LLPHNEQFSWKVTGNVKIGTIQYFQVLSQSVSWAHVFKKG